jgi:hypothetical protein
LSLGSIGLAWLLGQDRALAADRERPPLEPSSYDLLPKRPHFEPRAKRVIFLFMKGGPSAIDTFDPKPLLDRDHGKPFPGTRPRVTFAKTLAAAIE